MGIPFRASRSLVITVLVGVVLAAIVLPIFALANQGTLQSAAQSANVGRAATLGKLFNAVYSTELQTARELATFPDVGISAQAEIAEFEHNAQRVQTTQPEVTGAFLFGPLGNLLIGLQPDSAGAFSPSGTVPTGLNVSSNTALGKALAGALVRNVEGQVLSVAAGAGSLGDLYLYEPVTSPEGASLGAVVLRIDNEAVVGRFITGQNALLVAPPFIISGATRGMMARHSVQVLRGAPASDLNDRSIVGGVTPVADTDLSAQSAAANGTFTYQGSRDIGGTGTLDAFPAFHVIVYSTAPTFVSSLLQTALGPVGILLVILFIAGTAVLFVYQENRITTVTAAVGENKSRLLTEDILEVSQALSIAREGDLTVEIPSAASEVGLVSVLVNGLLSDYSQMVAGIIRASRAVQDGALRVDEGVRAIVESASRQGDELTETAGTVEALAGSAAVVQDATRQATELAGEASQSVQQGQDAVGRIGEAVDSIKEAAIGTTREFKRLQEDSILLTALVSSVKSNAENLDMQAANAALEARHLGTETGSAFATNIGRLARQAQETLADTETAVRSVISSIDAVNRRIERISEQVRLGVDEVRSVRSSFENITDTNLSLTRYIEQVAGTAQEQAGNAQRAARSIGDVAAAFQRFNEMLISSGDEMAHMRLIVADLQESVSTLKVDETLLDETTDGAPAAEIAA